MFSLPKICITPAITNCEVHILKACDAETISSEFLPTAPTQQEIFTGFGVDQNEEKKTTIRKEATGESNIKRKVDIYPEDPDSLKLQLTQGLEVVIITEAYGTESGYLESVKAFDTSNQLCLCICLAKQ